ncbi:protealysin inhibitor emfourin [Actinomadura chokoriensis]|uniref:protealysin inhibitor emfourin n=1 Tax=Actinomadura chokoriensis TaxID=454156 RepID=UPI0031F72CE9
MRVKIESTGGFTGRNAVVALYDTSALPAGRAGRIREAVDALAAAQARGGPDEAGGGPGEIGADLPAYRITVDETGEEPRVFEVRGDPTTGAASVLGALLRGPDDPA